MITGCASNSDISSISKISDYSSNDNTSSYETDDTLDDEVEYYYSDDTPIYSFEKRYEKIKEQYKDRYEEFYNRFCCVDDGHAAQRVVEKEFK